jgi:hypothetical protein
VKKIKMMKKIIVFLSLFMAITACQPTISEPKEDETDLEEEIEAEEELDALGKAVKGSLLESYHKLKMLNENGMLWRLQLVFDLHSADCGAPDCYAHHLQLVLPPHILAQKEGSYIYNLNVKGCVPEEEQKEQSGSMQLYARGTNYIIFYDKKEELSLLLEEQNAYLFEGLNFAILDSKAPIDYLKEILEDPEHLYYPYQSRTIVFQEAN